MADVTKFDLIEASQIPDFFSMVERCTDSYVFLMDSVSDSLMISENALKEFCLPGTTFPHATSELLKIVDTSDRDRFSKNLKSIAKGTPVRGIEEYKFIDKEKEIVSIRFHGTFLRKKNLKYPLLLGTVEKIDKKSNSDKLTGCATELMLFSDFDTIYKKDGKVSGFILKVDIDNLGDINERYGNDQGDQIIKILYEGCAKSVSKRTAIYRCSDGFYCMNLSEGRASDAQHIYTGLKRQIRESEQKTEYRIIFTVSASTIAFFNDRSCLDDLLKKLEFSMKMAKTRGKNNMSLFNAGEYARHLYRLDLQEQLRISIKNNFKGFELFYQPVIDARKVKIGGERIVDFKVIGSEALLRWSSPGLGRLSADEFIPVLEESGLIIPVGRWVLLTAFKQCRKWNELMPNFRMSVNLSYIQIQKSDIVFDVQMALDRSKVNPDNLVLEITESGYVDNNDLQKLLVAFAKMHIKIDIDDFGTGYSNLRYLQDIHANTLKLDYSFIRKALSGQGKDNKVIEYITKMAHDLDMNVCMEGIESDDDVKKLDSMNPDTYQGFLFGKPVDAVTFMDQNFSKYISEQ
ncbi:MAG: GGDEF domain-containing phosphodiesterase [Treponema sp.]|jgi:diguanylate cyclase (GGDEF)-like protein|nr:GGDEF domain-containing phosphodiesterase [Treponema sp.]